MVIYVPKSIRSPAFLCSSFCSRSRNSGLVSVGMLATQSSSHQHYLHYRHLNFQQLLFRLLHLSVDCFTAHIMSFVCRAVVQVKCKRVTDKLTIS